MDQIVRLLGQRVEKKVRSRGRHNVRWCTTDTSLEMAGMALWGFNMLGKWFGREVG